MPQDSWCAARGQTAQADKLQAYQYVCADLTGLQTVSLILYYLISCLKVFHASVWVCNNSLFPWFPVGWTHLQR